MSLWANSFLSVQKLIPCAALAYQSGVVSQCVGSLCAVLVGVLDDVLPSVQSKIRFWMRNKPDAWNMPTQNGKQTA